MSIEWTEKCTACEGNGMQGVRLPDGDVDVWECDRCAGSGGEPVSRALAAARREGWAQAIEALRDQQRFVEWLRAQPFEARPFTVSSVQHARRAADYLTDRAAALTEEGT